MWPGEFKGAKFNLYSLDKESKSFHNKKLGLDFINQYTFGIHINTIIDLTQFNSNLIQITLGSKIENKLFIIYKKKF